jgi:hypothetical protein
MTNGNSPANMLDQCLVAFGQGSGPLLISQAAIDAMKAQYEPIFALYDGNWDDDRATVFMYAQMLGRLSAEKALGDGSIQIERDHFVSALRDFQSRAGVAGGWRACPVCP